MSYDNEQEGLKDFLINLSKNEDNTWECPIRYPHESKFSGFCGRFIYGTRVGIGAIVSFVIFIACVFLSIPLVRLGFEVSRELWKFQDKIFH